MTIRELAWFNNPAVIKIGGNLITPHTFHSSSTQPFHLQHLNGREPVLLGHPALNAVDALAPKRWQLDEGREMHRVEEMPLPVEPDAEVYQFALHRPNILVADIVALVLLDSFQHKVNYIVRTAPLTDTGQPLQEVGHYFPGIGQW